MTGQFHLTVIVNSITIASFQTYVPRFVHPVYLQNEPRAGIPAFFMLTPMFVKMPARHYRLPAARGQHERLADIKTD